MVRRRAARLDREIAEALSQPKEQLEYRPVGSDGDPWPAWLLATKNSCGIYVIRYKTGEPLYAGSSDKRLYGTVTRHFQQWRRSKAFWRGYAAGRPNKTDHDPGIVYQRGRCEVGIRVMECGDDVLEEEAKLIQRLRPRDNLVENPDGLEDAPF